ncbi:unnamed protein product, partial [Didymodactylos carnosus]
MPRKYVRKHEEHRYSNDNFEAALQELSAGAQIRATANRYNIPYLTLQEHNSVQVSRRGAGRSTHFTEMEESYLVKAVTVLQQLRKCFLFIFCIKSKLLNDDDNNSDKNINKTLVETDNNPVHEREVLLNHHIVSINSKTQQSNISVTSGTLDQDDSLSVNILRNSVSSLSTNRSPIEQQSTNEKDDVSIDFELIQINASRKTKNDSINNNLTSNDLPLAQSIPNLYLDHMIANDSLVKT